MPAVVDAHDVEVAEQHRLVRHVVAHNHSERSDVDETANCAARPDTDPAPTGIIAGWSSYVRSRTSVFTPSISFGIISDFGTSFFFFST
jgi:hypothetical protein